MNKRQLLIREIFARAPYGVPVKYQYWDEEKYEETTRIGYIYQINIDGYVDVAQSDDGEVDVEQIRLLLRKKSSMTQQEIDELEQFLNHEYTFTLNETEVNIYNNFIANTQHTSTQTIDQNGVTTYFVYDTGSESYNANIFL